MALLYRGVSLAVVVHFRTSTLTLTLTLTLRRVTEVRKWTSPRVRVDLDKISSSYMLLV